MPSTDKKPCVWAAELIERLAESGTPADKLATVRDAMAARWAATAALGPDDPTRHLSAVEALELLRIRFGDEHGTPKKAREFIEHGFLEAPKPPVHPSELIPRPPMDKAPVATEGVVATAPAPRLIAGVTDLGTHDIPTTGPKPVPAEKAKGKKAAEKQAGSKPKLALKKPADKPVAGAKDLLAPTEPPPLADGKHEPPGG